MWVKLRIAGDILNFEELTSVFSKEIIHICKKNDKIYDKYRKESRIYPEDVFLIEQEYAEDQTPEQAILDFITRLLPHRDFLQSERNHADVLLWVSLYPNGWHENLLLSPLLLSKLAELALPLDVELSFLQSIYEGDS